MFTGIISGVGELTGRENGRFTIRCGYDAASIAIGASMACDGCCLSATSVRAEPTGAVFTVDVSNETLSKTTLGSWQPGRKINLERALLAGGEFGGHIVAGHIDGVARIVEVRADGASRRVLFEAPAALARLIAPKGSIALDGTSLTVNEVEGARLGVNLIPLTLTETTWGSRKPGDEVEGARFGVNLIPLTLTETTWGSRKPGEEVNLEVDLFARYVARLMEYRS